MKKWLSRWFKRIKSYPDYYNQSTIPLTFHEIDIKKLKKKMELEEKGRERGEKNLPHSDSTSFDNIEQDIETFINSEIKETKNIFETNHDSYYHRMQSLGITGDFAQIEFEAGTTLTKFKIYVQQGVGELHRYWKNVININKYFDVFKKKNGINRIAQYPESWVLHISIILLLLITEGVANGLFLARGHELGYVGGVGTALIIAAFNVAFGFFIGKTAFPYVLHRHSGLKIMGGILTLIYLIAILIFNLGVAHYRDALGGQIPEQAAQIALKNFKTIPFGIADIESWMLLLVGIGFSLTAAGDGFKWDDPYPKYGKLVRKRNEIVQEFVERKQDIMTELGDVWNKSLRAINFLQVDINSKINEYKLIYARVKNLESDFKNQLDHLENVANDLFAIYRQVNEETRTTPPPKTFSKMFRIPPEKPSGNKNIEPISKQTEKEIERVSRKSITKYVKQVNSAYESAINNMNKIGKLI